MRISTTDGIQPSAVFASIWRIYAWQGPIMVQSPQGWPKWKECSNFDYSYMQCSVMQGESFKLPPFWPDLAIYPKARARYIQKSFDILPEYVSVLVSRYKSRAYLAKESENKRFWFVLAWKPTPYSLIIFPKV